MKRIVFDFSPIKSGGGVQLALNFIRNFEKFNKNLEVFYLFPDSGPLTSAAKEFDGKKFFIAPTKPLKRFIFETKSLKKILQANKIEIIYTFFGAGLPHGVGIKSYVGVAYPIICYPDSEFWNYLSVKHYIKQKIVNYIRIYRLRKTTKIICETHVMKNRLVKCLSLPVEHFIVIPPTVTEYVYEVEPRKHFNGRFLLLSGPSQHKNLWRLNQIVKVADSLDLKIKFIVSVSRKEFLSNLKDKNIYYDLIDKYLEFTGSIPSEKISTLYDSCDVMLNLSDLESFSNNYMEAWKSGMPIVASDRDFAREICKDSAIYVEPHSPESVVAGLKKISENPVLRYELATNGKKLLKKLPNMGERINLLLELFSDEKRD